MMRKIFIYAAAVLAVGAGYCSQFAIDSCGQMTQMTEEDGEENPFSYVEYDFERWYAGAGGTIVLAQGGSKMHRRAGALARAGYYAGDFLAVEASAAWLERGAELGVRGLWHWWGYEKFDPFFTFGANGWIEGDIGPSLGCGAFWHFSDNWSVRFDADATLGLDGNDAMVYQLGLAVQYSF